MKLIYETYDKFTGMTDRIFFQEGVNGEKGTMTVQRLQDVEHILAMNKVQKNNSQKGYGDSNGFHKIASIPFIVIEQWFREGFDWYNSTDKERRAKLNSREYQHLLVREGKL